MKTTKRFLVAAFMAILAVSASAQQVNTLYFLENAPMRHTINPAFQPVSAGYVNFTPLGWMSYSFGNNSLTLSDVIYTIPDPNDPSKRITITPLYPSNDPNNPAIRRTAFLNQLRSMLYFNGDATLGLLNFGFRIKDFGYVTVGVNERIETGMTAPKSMFNFFLGGGMTNLEGGTNTLGLSGIGAGGTAYTEIALGYSHKLNEQWTIGGKLKILLGQAYAGMTSKNFNLNASTEAWNLTSNLNIDAAGPFNAAYLAQYVQGKSAMQVYDAFTDGSFKADSLINTRDIPAMLRPSGGGAAIDFGFTYKPIENLQITAALTDLGFISWGNGTRFNCVVDTTFNGLGDIKYGDEAYKDQNGNFSTDILMDSVVSNLKGLLNGVRFAEGRKAGFTRMVSTRLNVGLDANFWDNRVGVGILSATRLYNARLYEEITLGAAFRPFNWLSLALSYSLMNNGKYSNIGAGLSLMPYDGVNMTLTMDYIPTSYAGKDFNNSGKPMYVIPDKTKMFNIALGFSIVWGTNKRDSDKDGVWDKIDMCKDTPRGVAVYPDGCPVDSDGDGVPDYKDNCPETPAVEADHVDEYGCTIDTDGDGVPDYRDLCPNTPAEAYGKIDSVGCPLDSDGDGVPDYLDECPDTPEEAYGMVDEKGCPIDRDRDGVADYMDACPDTPVEAQQFISDEGCTPDSDGDGVEDYKDKCPNTPKEAIGHVGPDGCELDTDGDGVPDYLDACPTVPGLKNNKGCPELKREVRQLLKKAMQGIEFETGKSTIKPKSYPLLNQIADIFIENKNYIIEVQGHTDSTGKYDFNMKLSDDRANTVRDYLIGKGVPFERMTAKGYGPDVPIADNKTAAGRQKNRRVEFNITFEEVHVETILDHADPAEAPAETPAEAPAETPTE